jgi:chromosome partitioning protein
MSIICFSSLKGGVGKTTLTVNTAAAFAAKGCETLIIDLDPASHATNFFCSKGDQNNSSQNIAHLLLGVDFECEKAFQLQQLETLLSRNQVQKSIRTGLSLISAGHELKHFLWGKGARIFKELFPTLIKCLKNDYDYIIIDTPPDYNVLTRNAIGQSDLVVIPVDPSAMSINCLEQLIENAEHIKKPSWSIVRTMVNRQATRLQKEASARLNQNLFVTAPTHEDEDEFELDLQDPDHFISFVERQESSTPSKQNSNSNNDSPLFLLNSLTYRTEQQNRLTFAKKTCFDSSSYSSIAKQYLSLAKELEQILSLTEEATINLGDERLKKPKEPCLAASY